MSVEEDAAQEADKKGLTGDERERYIGGAINKARHFLHRRIDGKPPEKTEYERFLEKHAAAQKEAEAEAKKREERQTREKKIAELDHQIEEKTRQKRKAQDDYDIFESQHRKAYSGATRTPNRGITRLENKLNKSADEKLLALQDALETKQRELNELHKQRRELVYHK